MAAMRSYVEGGYATYEWNDNTFVQGLVSVSSNSSTILTAKSFHLARDDALLIEDATFSILRGKCYGLAGENGCGKSTLMRALLSLVESMSDNELRCVYVGQDDAERSASVEDSVLVHCSRGNPRINVLQDELERLESLPTEGDANLSPTVIAARMDELITQLDLLGVDDVEKRARAVLKALAFTESVLETPVNCLSGGWRTRLELSRALFAKPDVLLLDEPTNHLDLCATLRLVVLIRTAVTAGTTVLLVSHDAAFMDMVCTDMLSIHKAVLMTCTGNYAAFEAKADQYRAFHERIYAARVEKESKAAASINKQKQVARRTGNDKALKQAAARERKVEAMAGNYREDGKRFKRFSLEKLDVSCLRLPSKAAPISHHSSVTLALPDYPAPHSLAAGEVLMVHDDVNIGYDFERPIVEHFTTNIVAGDRIALVGENGSGKSTLMQYLSGVDLHTDLASQQRAAAITSSRRSRITLIDQNHLEALVSSAKMSAVEYVTSRHSDLFKDDGSIRSHLARFGLGGKELPLQPIETLSGGLRVRVMLADAFAGRSPPDVLLLDEPTNHLDAETITALADALDSFKGAVVTVSHNCAFLLRLCRDLWICEPPGGRSAPAGTPSRITKLIGTKPGDFAQNFRDFAVRILPKSQREHVSSMLQVRFMRHAAVVQQPGAVTSLVV